MNVFPGLILGLPLANERRRYFVTTSLIGWAQAKNQSCISEYCCSHMFFGVLLNSVYIWVNIGSNPKPLSKHW